MLCLPAARGRALRWSLLQMLIRINCRKTVQADECQLRTIRQLRSTVRGGPATPSRPSMAYAEPVSFA